MKTIEFPNDLCSGLFIAFCMGVDEARNKSGEYCYDIENFNRKSRKKSKVKITVNNQENTFK